MQHMEKTTFHLNPNTDPYVERCVVHMNVHACIGIGQMKPRRPHLNLLKNINTRTSACATSIL